MAAGTYNITIEKRATFSITLTFKNADGSEYDLSGSSLVSQIRIDSSNAIQSDFTANIVGDPTNGVATLSLTKEQTSALSTAPSSYDLFVDKIDGTSEKLLSGSVLIIGNETEYSATPSVSQSYSPRRNISFLNSELISSDEFGFHYVDTGSFFGIDVFALNNVYANQDCRVRLYNSIDYDDLSRSIYEDAPNDAGLIAEASLTSGQVVQFTPALISSTNKATNSGQSIMAAITTSSQQELNSVSGHFDILQFL